jgi:hypothetical protein
MFILLLAIKVICIELKLFVTTQHLKARSTHWDMLSQFTYSSNSEPKKGII